MALIHIKEFHVHVTSDEAVLKTILEHYSLITKKLDQVMANSQERFDALMARLDTVSNDIAADYAQLIEEAKKGQVSEESFAKAEANIAKLEALGASVDNPVPPTEPTEPTTGG